MGHLVLALVVLTAVIFTPGLQATDDFPDCFWVAEDHIGRRQAQYIGTHNTSVSGFACIPWKLVTKNIKLEVTYAEYEDIVHAQNYCRDPTFYGVPWCYVDHPLEMEACDVPFCYHVTVTGPLRYLTDCFVMNQNQQARGALYLGVESQTHDGKTCQQWGLIPDLVSRTEIQRQLHVINLMALGAFCRDASGLGYPWCYTDFTRGAWGACNIFPCSPKTREFSRNVEPRPWTIPVEPMSSSTLTTERPLECFWLRRLSGNVQAVYLGTTNVSSSGQPCQYWNISSFGESVKEAKNYCRDPYYLGVPLCYTPDGGYLDVCDVPYCTQRSETAAEASSLNHCFITAERDSGLHAFYFGVESTTVRGRTCQPWSRITDPVLKRQVRYFQKTMNFANLGNFCRDVGTAPGTISCFVDDNMTMMEECNVKQCPDNTVLYPDLIDLYPEDQEEWIRRKKALLRALEHPSRAPGPLGPAVERLHLCGLVLPLLVTLSLLRGD